MTEKVEAAKAAHGRLAQHVTAGAHVLVSDVPESLGGEDAGPTPHDLLDAALAACTALTVTMVARRRQLPLNDLKVTVAHVETEGLYRLVRTLEFIGPLDAEQKTYLTGIANRCPIHKLLSGRIEIETSVSG